jgi:hypothetical protein
MPGPFFFTWIDGPVPFDPVAHAVEDEAIVEFQITQSEGDFAGMTMTVVNPGMGLLAPGRVQWCWLSWQGDTLVPLFCGRLVAVPEAIDGEAVRLLFAARPRNYGIVKRDYAETLKVLPYYDPVWISGNLDDPDAVLNGYGAQWHIARDTLEVTHSDELDGEDGTITIGEADHTYDDFSASYAQAPISRVDLEGTLSWTQAGNGTIDLTGAVYNLARATKSIYVHPLSGVISSLTGEGLISDWPKPGTDFGGGWSVNFGTYAENASKGWKRYSYQVRYRTLTPEAQQAMHDFAASDEGAGAQIALGAAQAQFYAWTDYIVQFPVWAIKQAARFDYHADRPRTEIVRCSLIADIQPLLAEPDDEENIVKVSISASNTVTEPDDDGLMAIGDPRRNSYLNTDRGTLSFQYLLLLGRAELRRRARAVDVQCRVPWASGIAATLRQNAHVVDRRLPAGEAFGKITGYGMSAGTSGFYVDLTIGCAVGRGGSVTAAAGTPTWVEAGYVAAGYQQMAGAEAMLPTGDFVYGSFENAIVNDDGVDLLHFDARQAVLSMTISGGMDDQIRVINAVQDPIDALGHYPTRLCFNLRPVAGMSFETAFTPASQPLPIPKWIDLEAA